MRGQSAVPPAPDARNSFPGCVPRNGVRGWRLERWRSSEPNPGAFLVPFGANKKEHLRMRVVPPPRRRVPLPTAAKEPKRRFFPAPWVRSPFRRANPEWLPAPLPGHWALARQKFGPDAPTRSAWLVPCCLAWRWKAGGQRPPLRRSSINIPKSQQKESHPVGWLSFLQIS